MDFKKKPGFQKLENQLSLWATNKRRLLQESLPLWSSYLLKTKTKKTRKQVVRFPHLVCEIIFKNQCLLNLFSCLKPLLWQKFRNKYIDYSKNIEFFPFAVSEPPPTQKTNNTDSSCSLTPSTSISSQNSIAQ